MKMDQPKFQNSSTLFYNLIEQVFDSTVETSLVEGFFYDFCERNSIEEYCLEEVYNQIQNYSTTEREVNLFTSRTTFSQLFSLVMQNNYFHHRFNKYI